MHCPGAFCEPLAIDRVNVCHCAGRSHVHMQTMHTLHHTGMQCSEHIPAPFPVLVVSWRSHDTDVHMYSVGVDEFLGTSFLLYERKHV